MVQSKYGTSFQGAETIVDEGRKVIATLAGQNARLSETVSQLMERLATFRQQASDRDRIVLVFATEQPISELDRRSLNEIRLLGSDQFPNVFDVEDISLQTIWEARDTGEAPAVSLPVFGNFVDPGPGVRVGTIPLTRMYDFLAAYRDKTGNLDQLYEKNVRQFLGSRRKINRRCWPGPGHCPGPGAGQPVGQSQVQGQGGRQDQPGIVDQAVVVEGDADAVGVAAW